MHYSIAGEERKATTENLHLILIKNTKKDFSFRTLLCIIDDEMRWHIVRTMLRRRRKEASL